MKPVVYELKDLEEIFPFGKSKILRMCQTGALPVVKVGKTYITTDKQIEEWFEKHEGKEVFF